jgi:short-subunit dehydrogenase
MNPFNLSGKLALVTGATRGIGVGVAHAMAESEAGIILTGREQSYLDQSATRVPAARIANA